MMDVEEVRVGEQLVGVFHFWEIEAGALNKPRVAQIADANKNAGHVIAYHEKTADNLYTTRMRFSAVHFTDKDVRAFSVAYRMKNLLP